MQLRKIFTFLFEAAIAGLAFAFILLLIFRPQALQRPVAQVQESPAPEIITREASPAPAQTTSEVTSYAQAVEAAAPAVVNIYTTKVVTQRLPPIFEDPFFRRFFGDELNGGIPQKRLETSLGSGVIISTQGYILTNNHVIEGADEILVSLHDGRTANATVVGTDPETDVGVLKINLPKLPIITLGQSDALRVGDVVLAIGNPFGVGQTVTHGIVSATGRTQLGISTFENFIQTDAPINPGNSGGALINTAGQLIGINTAIFSRSGGSQGIGFAIPTSLARSVMQQIVEHGHVIRGWLGVNTQDITPALAESFGLSGTQGAIIAGVYRNSPADAAGLRRGDIITQIGDKPVSNAKEAMNIIAQHAPGKTVAMRIIRNGQNLKVEARVGERPTK